MTDDTDRPQIYAIDEQDSDEPSDDPIEIHNLAGGGDGDGVFVESNGTAELESYVDETDFGNADVTNVRRFEYQLAIDKLEESTPTGSVTIDVSAASVWDVDVGGDLEIGFSGASDAGVYSVTLLLDRGDGGHEITWDANVEWEDGEAPDLTGDGLAVVTAFSRDEGATWQAVLGGSDFA